MAKPEPYWDARKAAEYAGYTPGVDAAGRAIPAHKDRQMRAFYEWVRRHAVETKYRGSRLLFRQEWLDVALDRSTDEQRAKRNEKRNDRLEEMGELARRHARGEDIRLM